MDVSEPRSIDDDVLEVIGRRDLDALRAAGFDVISVSDQRHLIQFEEGEWTILHPITERLDDAESLFDCTASWEFGPPIEDGRYVLTHDAQNDFWMLGERIA